jgi:cell division protein FtsN
MSGAAESSEVAQKFNPTHEASQSAHKNSSGMRVMRTSPVTLISCGLVFVSLIFLLNFMAQRGARAEQSAGNQAASNNQEKNSTASVASVQQPRPQTNVTVPQPKPSVETASIVPAVEAAPVAPKVENEKPQPTPTPAPTPAEKQAIKVEPPPAAAPAGEDGFTLQVGSYNELSQAQERAAKLGSVGVNAYVARVEIPKRGTWYRVQTGRFSNREEAVRYGTQLRSKGMVADFIVAPSKAS